MDPNVMLEQQRAPVTVVAFVKQPTLRFTRGWPTNFLVRPEPYSLLMAPIWRNRLFHSIIFLWKERNDRKSTSGCDFLCNKSSVLLIAFSTFVSTSVAMGKPSSGSWDLA